MVLSPFLVYELLSPRLLNREVGEFCGYVLVAVCMVAPALFFFRAQRKQFAKKSPAVGSKHLPLAPMAAAIAGWGSLFVNTVRGRSLLIVEFAADSKALDRMILPALQRASDVVTVQIRNWDGDWEAGPMLEALDALAAAAAMADGPSGERLRASAAVGEWKRSADLVGLGPAQLAQDLEVRLRVLREDLGLRPVVIARDFDRYRTRHAPNFEPSPGMPISSADLRERNHFWGLMAGLVEKNAIHLFVATSPGSQNITRCLEFVPKGQRRR